MTKGVKCTLPEAQTKEYYPSCYPAVKKKNKQKAVKKKDFVHKLDS